MNKNVNEALKIEQLLKQLAEWSVTRGNKIPVKTAEDFNKMQFKVNQRWAEFKRLIVSGEFTLKELQQDQINRYGVVLPSSDNPTLSRPSA